MEQIARPGRTDTDVSPESCRVAPSALSMALSRSMGKSMVALDVRRAWTAADRATAHC